MTARLDLCRPFENYALPFAAGNRRDLRNVLQILLIVRPERDRFKGLSFGRAVEKYSTIEHTVNHSALEREPSCSKTFLAGRLRELVPEIVIRIAPVVRAYTV